MKKIINKVVLLSVLGLNAQSVLAQQNVQFSQYVFNPLALNTAYAGYRGESYATAMFRKQWSGLQGSPETISASFEFLMPKTDDRVAWSVRLLSDKLGPQNTLSATGGYTYRIPMDEDKTKNLAIGLGGGITQYIVDGSAYRYVDDNDSKLPIGNVRKIRPDANVGLYYSTPKFYVQTGINDLLNFKGVSTSYNWNNTVFETMERRMHVYTGAGMVFNLGENFKLKPSFLWKEDFKGPSNFDFNMFFLIKEIVWVGGSYRTGFEIWDKAGIANGLQHADAASIMVEFFPVSKFRIGYSYDITTSKLSPYQNGTHEISIGVAIPGKEKRELSPRYF